MRFFGACSGSRASFQRPFRVRFRWAVIYVDGVHRGSRREIGASAGCGLIVQRVPAGA